MLILSDDKSARAQFAALVEMLEKDVKDARFNRDKHSKRSLDYARFTGHIEALNETIATIMTTDVWHEPSVAMTPLHYHLEGAEGPEVVTTDTELAREWLTTRGYPADDLWAAFLQGANVVRCRAPQCLTKGKWLAKSNTAQNS